MTTGLQRPLGVGEDPPPFPFPRLRLGQESLPTLPTGKIGAGAGQSWRTWWLASLCFGVLAAGTWPMCGAEASEQAAGRGQGCQASGTQWSKSFASCSPLKVVWHHLPLDWKLLTWPPRPIPTQTGCFTPSYFSHRRRRRLGPGVWSLLSLAGWLWGTHFTSLGFNFHSCKNEWVGLHWGSILGINGLNFMEFTHPLYIVCKTVFESPFPWESIVFCHILQENGGRCEGQGRLACCSLWGHKELNTSDWTPPPPRELWVNWAQPSSLTSLEWILATSLPAAVWSAALSLHWLFLCFLAS